MATLATLQSGDDVRSYIDRLAAAVRALQATAVTAATGPMQVQGNTLHWQGDSVRLHVAKIVAAAGEEEEFTDARYWVDVQGCALDESDDETTLAAIAAETAPWDLHCVATNLAELAEGTHVLAAGTPVLLMEIADLGTPRQTRYVFVEPPRAVLFANVVSVVDTGNAGSYLTAHPCNDPPGSGEDTSVVWRVELGVNDPSIRSINVAVGATIGVCRVSGMLAPPGEVGGFWCLSNVYDAPHGTIRMENAAYDAPVPHGWALCDGANGTPDLRDRFPMGLGGTLFPTGGSVSHTHADHLIAGGADIHAPPTDVVAGPAQHNNATHLPPYFAFRFLIRL